MSTGASTNGTDPTEAIYVKWNVRDGVLFGLILLAWISAVIMFLHKWGSFRLPQPRNLIRRFRPMNVDDVRVISKENKSVIYKTYSQRMSVTMGDRKKRLEARQAENQKEATPSPEETLPRSSSLQPSGKKSPGRFAIFDRSPSTQRREPTHLPLTAGASTDNETHLSTPGGTSVTQKTSEKKKPAPPSQSEIKPFVSCSDCRIGTDLERIQLGSISASTELPLPCISSDV